VVQELLQKLHVVVRPPKPRHRIDGILDAVIGVVLEGAREVVVLDVHRSFFCHALRGNILQLWRREEENG
jgi:hypothetical protein